MLPAPTTQILLIPGYGIEKVLLSKIFLFFFLKFKQAKNVPVKKPQSNAVNKLFWVIFLFQFEKFARARISF
jgi:hypothetical protein